jgi:hypothetical protein
LGHLSTKPSHPGDSGVDTWYLETKSAPEGETPAGKIQNNIAGDSIDMKPDCVDDNMRLAAIRVKLMEAEKLLYETNKIVMYMLDHDDEQHLSPSDIISPMKPQTLDDMCDS